MEMAASVRAEEQRPQIIAQQPVSFDLVFGLLSPRVCPEADPRLIQSRQPLPLPSIEFRLFPITRDNASGKMLAFLHSIKH